MKVKSDISVLMAINKELDAMHGLNEYDYHARQMDPIIGQFNSMDPLCEKYYHISPYAYCAGNPVRYVDPDGMWIDDYYSLSGKYLFSQGEGTAKYVFKDDKERKDVMKHKKTLSEATSLKKLPSDEALSASLSVLERAEGKGNGGKYEETALVMNDGNVVYGKRGTETNAVLPQVPEGKTLNDVEASIHSHPTFVKDIANAPNLATKPSFPTDEQAFKNFNTNIIVGAIEPPININSGKPFSTPEYRTGATGVVIYYYNEKMDKFNRVVLKVDAVSKILNPILNR